MTTKPRSREEIRKALEARQAQAMKAPPAQAGLELGGFGTRTQPNLF
jgi:hypothetical protein